MDNIKRIERKLIALSIFVLVSHFSYGQEKIDTIYYDVSIR